jgi:hypothetical protein
MRIATTFIAILTGIFLFFAAEAMAGEPVYRWVDENGIVHFGDRPDGHKDAEIVDIQEDSSGVNQSSSSNLSAEAEAQADPDQPTYAQQLRDDRAKSRKEREENRQITAEACEQRQQLVAQLEPSTRVIVEYEDGTVARLDDNERLKNLNEAKTYIAENCNK